MRVRLLHKRSQPTIAATIRALEQAGASVEVLASDDASQIPGLVESSSNDRLIVSGGDGMIHHAVQALAGTDIPLGIVPAGTGNDIARALRIPSKLTKSVPLALGPVRPIDLVSLCDEAGVESYAVSVLTAGFSGRVTQAANQISWAGGQLKYTVATLWCLPKLRQHAVEGLPGHDVFSILAFGNTRFFGGGMSICPTASPFDDRIELVIVDAVHPLHLAAVLPAAFVGQHVRSRKVHVEQLRHTQLEVDTSWWADGEPLPQSGPVTIRSVPKALQLAVGVADGGRTSGTDA